MPTKKSEDADAVRPVPPSREAEPGTQPLEPASAPDPTSSGGEPAGAVDASPARSTTPVDATPVERPPYAAAGHEASGHETTAQGAGGTGPASVPPHADAAEEEAHEDERGRSFAARALTFLLILLAGAGLGIWAAPRIAPLLPAGLAPVAAWLTPGQAETEARIAALETRLDGELGALGERIAALPDAAAVESGAQGLVDSARTDLAAQIDALAATLAQSDVSDAGERIGRLETALDGATAELASLRDQIASGATTLSEDAAQSVDTYRAELEGLRAEVGRLAGSVSGLGGRLDEIEASAEARVTDAQQAAAQVEAAAAAERDLSAAETDVALIRAALASGAPFEAPLASLAENAGASPPAGLSAAAASGVATPAALRASFSDAAHAAIRSSIVAGAGDGLFARSRAFLQAQAASRSLTPQPGLSPDAVLSRIEDALRRDDLATALTETDQLPSEARAAMADWIAAARLRAGAEAGLAELSASVSTLN